MVPTIGQRGHVPSPLYTFPAVSTGIQFPSIDREHFIAKTVTLSETLPGPRLMTRRRTAGAGADFQSVATSSRFISDLVLGSVKSLLGGTEDMPGFYQANFREVILSTVHSLLWYLFYWAVYVCIAQPHMWIESAFRKREAYPRSRFGDAGLKEGGAVHGIGMAS